MKKSLYFGIFCCWLGFSLPVVANPLPDISQSFQLQAERLDAQRIQLNWQIQDQYFLLASKFRFSSLTPGLALDEPTYPEPKIEHDDFFGDVAVYRQQLQLQLPYHLENPSLAAEDFKLEVLFQGCLNMSACYPPYAMQLTLPPAKDNSVATTEADSKLADADDNEIFGENQFLDPEQAFIIQVDSQPDTHSAVINWQIAPGYYLYRERLQFSLKDSNGQTLAINPEIPRGEEKHDPSFGRVEVFHHALSVKLPLPSEATQTLQLNVAYQGCAEAGLCYPVQEYSQTLNVAAAEPTPPEPAPSAALNLGNAGGLSGALAQLGQQGSLSGALNAPADDDFLDPEQAFALNVEWDNQARLFAVWQIADGYYLYRHKLRFELLSGGTLQAPILPQGESKEDDYFGQVEVYHQQLVAELPLSASADTLRLKIEYQGCAEAGLCYPPQEQTLNIRVPEALLQAPAMNTSASADTLAAKQSTKPAPPQALAETETSETQALERAAPAAATAVAEEELSEQDRLAAYLQQNLFLALLIFFGSGVLLAFTPCVFPMIPILSSIIAGQGYRLSTGKAFQMSLVYVLAMACTYSIAGVLVAVLGANVQAAFQNVWVLGAFAAVFVLLALSMFGFYELQIPSSWQSRLNEISNRQQGGTLIGVAIMGFLSALIVGPCVAAPLMGAFIYISHTGDALLGGLALFSLSMGMGLPLLIIGTSAGKFLPHAGRWMETVKQVFGVMLLAVAIWMLERVLPAAWVLLLWAVLSIVSAVYMGALDSIAAQASAWRRFWKGIGLVLFIYGVLLLIGAASGAKDPTQPLTHLTAVYQANGTTANQHGLQFQRIKGPQGLQQALDAAKAAKQPVMLDFYADWCTSCIEFERKTFADARVQQALQGVRLLQADVTKNDAADSALLKQLGLIGPPSILFYDTQAQELTRLRIVGFMGAEKFLQHLDKALPVQQGDN